MKNIKNGMSKSVLSLILLIGAGCASDADKRLDQKLAQEPDVASSTQLTKEAQTDINHDSHFTPDQKVKLTKLREETSAELKSLRKQSLQLRALLIKDFEAENDSEIDLIHNRLQDINNRQVSLLFDSIKKANEIVGHIPRTREWIEEMFVGDRSRD